MVSEFENLAVYDATGALIGTPQNIAFVDASVDTYYDNIVPDGHFGATGFGSRTGGWNGWQASAEIDKRVLGGDILGRGAIDF